MKKREKIQKNNEQGKQRGKKKEQQIHDICLF